MDDDERPVRSRGDVQLPPFDSGFEGSVGGEQGILGIHAAESAVRDRRTAVRVDHALLRAGHQ